MEETILVKKLHTEIVKELKQSPFVHVSDALLDDTAWKIVHHVLEYHADACHLVVKKIKSGKKHV